MVTLLKFIRKRFKRSDKTKGLIGEDKTCGSLQPAQFHSGAASPPLSSTQQNKIPPQSQDLHEKVCFYGGDLLALETAFKSVKGVISTALCRFTEATSGASNQEVNDLTTAHEEAVAVIFDSKVISFASLCDVFWEGHERSRNTLRVQLAVDGRKIHSAIFCFSESQRRMAQQSRVQRQIKLSRRITTKILEASPSAQAGLHLHHHNSRVPSEDFQFFQSPLISPCRSPISRSPEFPASPMIMSIS